jgi:hypothetical protein
MNTRTKPVRATGASFRAALVFLSLWIWPAPAPAPVPRPEHPKPQFRREAVTVSYPDHIVGCAGRAAGRTGPQEFAGTLKPPAGGAV